MANNYNNKKIVDFTKIKVFFHDLSFFLIHNGHYFAFYTPLYTDIDYDSNAIFMVW